MKEQSQEKVYQSIRKRETRDRRRGTRGEGDTVPLVRPPSSSTTNPALLIRLGTFYSSSIVSVPRPTVCLQAAVASSSSPSSPLDALFSLLCYLFSSHLSPVQSLCSAPPLPVARQHLGLLQSSSLSATAPRYASKQWPRHKITPSQTRTPDNSQQLAHSKIPNCRTHTPVTDTRSIQDDTCPAHCLSVHRLCALVHLRLALRVHRVHHINS